MKRWDPLEYPPPDLVLEVDVTSASIARQPIYEKLRVPELWRYDGRTLTALHLNQDGEYLAQKRSLTFPFLTVNELLPFIEAADEWTDNELIRQFLDWVREQNFDVDATRG
jgi:Uma2 family endonuclease